MENAIKISRQVRSHQVKQHILEAAVELLTKYGYERVTVDNVCETANVSVGSFYHHFKDKGELLAYCFAAKYEKYSQKYENELGEDLIENIIIICNTYTKFCMEQGVQFIRNFYTPNNKCLDISDVDLEGETNLPIGTKVYNELKKANEKGYLIPAIDISRVVVDMCIIEKGFMFEWALTNGKYDLLQNVQRIFRHMLDNIASEKYKQTFK